MAYATRTYTPGSSTTTFALTTAGGSPIGYIQESDITVKVNGTTYTNAASGTSTYQISGTTTVEQPNGGNVVLNAGVTGTVILERNTAIQDATVVYTAGSTLTSTDLNNADNQIRFGLQEFSDDYASLNSTSGTLPNLSAFLGSSDTWVSNNSRAATTGAIDGRVASLIDTALTTDVSGGDGVTISDNSPSAGQIRIDLDSDIATLRNMQSGAPTVLAALTSTELSILDGASVTTAQLNRVDATSSIQTQLNAKQALATDLTNLSSCQSNASSALAALTQAEVQILDGATVSTTELNLLDGVPGTLTTAEIGFLDGVTSSIQTQLNAKQTTNANLQAIAGLSSADGNFIVGSASGWVAESGATARTSLGAQTAAADLTNLSTCQTGASAALALLTSTEVAILDGATPSTTQLNFVTGVTSAIQGQLDGKQPLDSELTTLAGMQGATASTLAAGTSLSATIAEINSICENRASQTTITDDDAKIPTSGAVVDYVAAQIAPIGGLEVVATEVAFPNTQPASGVVISISDAGGVVVNGSGVSTTGRTVGSSTVTINGFPSSLYSETLAAGVGLMVSSTGSSQTYTYHKLLAKEGDVKQLSDDINDFNERYRVSNGVPSGTDHAGDLYYDTGSDKMLVRNAANNAWEEVQSIGNFYISTLSPAFNGSLEDFTVSNAPTNAQQLLISINGVIQKPNSGTSRPSEGFALNGSTVLFSDPPASGADYFVVVIGSEVNIGAPSNNTVGNNQLMSGAVDNAKVATNAAIAYSKLAALADGNILVGNGSNVATSVNPSGDIDISNAGVFSISSGAIVNADVNASAAIAQSKLSLSITNSEVNASAAIAGSKLADDSIAEVKLDIHNAPSGTDKYLKYTSNGMEWATVPAGVGGANAVQFNDNVKAAFGTDGTGDLEIYHSGTSSFISEVGTGSLKITTNGTGVDIQKDSSETIARFITDGACELYHNNIKTFNTINNGIQVRGPEGAEGEIFVYADEGDDNADLWKIKADHVASGFYIQNKASGSWEDSLQCLGDGAVKLFHNNSEMFFTSASGCHVGSSSSAAHLHFLDGGIARFGGGNDLSIYHSGTDSHIVDSGTGNLKIDSSRCILRNVANDDPMVDCIGGGAVEIFHNGTKKCETTSSGITVTGGVTASGLSKGSGNLYINNNDTTNGVITIATNTNDCWRFEFNGDFEPHVDNSVNIGSATKRVANIYTGDLNLSNEGSTNDVDRTWGSYTIQEGADDLFLINKRNGKKYKFNLTEVG